MSAREIFGTPDVYTIYDITIQIRDLLVGGVPSDPSVIRSWLTARLDAGDTRLEEIFAETVAAMQGAGAGEVSMDEKLDALMASEAAPSVNGFKRLPSGELAYEGRCLKGGIKEWANSAFPGNDWEGKYTTGKDGKRTLAPGVAARKGLMSTLVERVFIDPSLIPLGTKEPSGVEERIKHVMTPQGPVSAISRVEVVQSPTLTVEMRVRDNFLTDAAWGRIWQVGEEIGLGSDRARSDGRFNLVSWTKRS